MATNSRAEPEASSAVESRDGMKPEVQDSEVQNGKSLLEGNGFKVIKKIGSGSYSKVKLAFSEQQKEMVAIKIVSKYHVPDEFLRKFFYNEIRVVKFLRHPNIIDYYQSIESSHRLYVIMQFAENGSILDLIHKEKRLPEARACHFFRQIVAAVEYCHSQGICHRDIKCENILLDSNMNVKLIDFGFARSFKKTSKAVTAIGSVAPPQQSSTLSNSERQPRVSETYCGSYAYASPEILKGTPYDPFQSDVWAMGCVLYAMVFGRLPFDDRDPHKLLKQVQSTINFPKSVNASEGFKTCITKILAPLNRRYTIQALKEDSWIKITHLNQSQSLPSRKVSKN